LNLGEGGIVAKTEKIAKEVTAVSGHEGLNFINVLCATSARADPQMHKNDSQVVNLFYAFGFYEHKSCA